MLTQVQWSHAQSVTRQHKRLFGGIPEHDGELTVEPFEGSFTPFLVGVDDDFGVAASAESVASRRQQVAQLEVVVDTHR